MMKAAEEANPDITGHDMVSALENGISDSRNAIGGDWLAVKGWPASGILTRETTRFEAGPGSISPQPSGKWSSYTHQPPIRTAARPGAAGTPPPPQPSRCVLK